MIPVVVGALRMISKCLNKLLQKIGVWIRPGHIQKTALLRAASMLKIRRVVKKLKEVAIPL